MKAEGSKMIEEARRRAGNETDATEARVNYVCVQTIYRTLAKICVYLEQLMN